MTTESAPRPYPVPFIDWQQPHVIAARAQARAYRAMRMIQTGRAHDRRSASRAAIRAVEFYRLARAATRSANHLAALLPAEGYHPAYTVYAREARESLYNAYMDARSAVTMTQTVYPKTRN